ncbi:uncharacterized protein A1O5_09907 [Cladophialophora psammophila CBS 110553]|uniref:Inheritance of peroxisomes protein 1 n=1 Tax=Cladophialophora psammophila CBS 110553 TaxID=1182543 RepID=W9WQI6_9EURO|nr:uncharacterized protein A1O5_09907 [Cladophialophora psammophila CBS 110553]EXJ67260.1 hypothetical protein A1O5_09907 [Cladophialophora psammophila CBS 110553]
MASPPPSYGEPPPLQSYRRSFTVPSRALSLHEKAGLDKSDADADILYSHPSARIIAFSPPKESIPPQSKETLPDADYPIDTVETLPWRSRSEILASTGPIVIEKVRGSSYFLKSADQKVIHTIMRNSQCWCVDGESKFVLRTGKFRYYRIELPSETEEDKKKVEELKTALPKVLRFERTPCPFKRAFHVDLPEDAITPRRKGTWKRKQQPEPVTPNTDPLPVGRTRNPRSWSFQGQNGLTSVQTYGRRGSDYGYSPSPSSSRSRPAIDGYRSSTPSSVASSEDVHERTQYDESSEDGLQHEEDHEEVDFRQKLDKGTDDASHPQRPPIAGEESMNLYQSSSSEHEGGRHEESEDVSPAQLADPSAVGAGAEPSIEVKATSIQSEQSDVDEISDNANAREPAEENLENEVHHERICPAMEHAEARPEGRREDDEEASVDGASDESIRASLTSVSTETESGMALSQKFEPLTDGAGVEAMKELASADTIEDTEEAPSLHQKEDFEAHEVVAAVNEGALSRVSSVDSFYTTDSATQEPLNEHVQVIDFDQAPHAEEFTPFSLNRNQHQRGLSELTVTASTVESERSPTQRPSTSDSMDKPSTPGLAQSSMSDSSWPEVHTPPSSLPKEGLRRRLNIKRSFSPLPPSTTLLSPSPSPTNYGSPFTAEFLQKAANVALVKPIEAVVLLVHILARIAGGATVSDLLSGELFRRPEAHRRRTSFPDQPPGPRDDSEEEDDFGVPIRGRTKSQDPSMTPGTTSTMTTKDDDPDSIFDLD